MLITCIILNYYIYNKKHISYENYTNKNKLCCIYAYYEKDDLYRSNFIYFLNNAILDNVDYYFVINGEYTVKIQDAPNIRVIERDNIGYDFGAYSSVIKTLYQEYDYYIFLNATVKGPYLNKNANDNWVDLFLKLFKTNVKLVGTSICFSDSLDIKNTFHKNSIYYVQTQFFIIKSDFFNYLKNVENFFNEEELNKITDMHYVIINKEIKLSYLCYKFGGKINCYLEKYKDLDHEKINYDINNSSFYGDAYWNNAYFCNTIMPEDVVFYKNKRFIIDTQNEKLKNILHSHNTDIIQQKCNNL